MSLPQAQLGSTAPTNALFPLMKLSRNKTEGFMTTGLIKNNDIFAVVWKDNNNVKLLSNHQGLERNQKMKRWSKQKKTEVTLE